MTKVSHRACAISDAGEAAFGKRGLSKLAEVTGLSKQLLSFIVNGDREVTDDVIARSPKRW
jgi:plasmid maintenance system antidote protein VapI